MAPGPLVNVVSPLPREPSATDFMEAWRQCKRERSDLPTSFRYTSPSAPCHARCSRAISVRVGDDKSHKTMKQRERGSKGERSGLRRLTQQKA